MTTIFQSIRSFINTPRTTKQKRQYLWNIVFVLFIMLLPIIEAPTRSPTKLLFLHNAYIVIDFVSHALCLAFVYLNFLYLAPKLYFQNQKVLYFVIVAGIFMLIATVPDFIEDHIYSFRVRTPENQRIHILIQIRHIFFIFFSLFIFSLYRLVEKKRLEAERLKNIAEINFLKAQINPHFLFNTLNSIYALTHINVTEAGKAIIKLSNIMRYTIYSSDNDFLPLKDAVDYIEDFIHLQKMRFGNTVEIEQDIRISGDYKIASLVLIPFIENAFKYGVYAAKPSKITIQLYNENEQLYFFVSNYNYSHLISRENSTGIGVTNTIKRLKDIYNWKQELKIKTTDLHYKVALTIDMS